MKLDGLKDRLRLWRQKPDVFVREVLRATPDPWQDEILREFPTSQRIALCASKGPGKSTILSWLAWNFLLTRPFPKIAATSISGDNLRDGLWSEMAKWRDRSPLLKELFQWQKERIFLKEAPETWWMSARKFAKSDDPQTLGHTLAGLHADYIMFELDEAGGMPDAIMATAEAALSSCKEGHLVIAGNPTHLEGPLFRACKTRERQMWNVKEITSDPESPMRSPRVSIQWAQEQIEKYGRDNPWVLVNVFGRFPPSGLNSLLGIDEIEAAVTRRYREDEFRNHPKILGVDCARYGLDSSVIFPRQGLIAYEPIVLRNADGIEGAQTVARKYNQWNADAIFIDDSGGFGSSWIDNLMQIGKSPIGIHFNSKPSDGQYFNKRAEMAFEVVNWIKRGGCIPDIRELKEALIKTTYSFKDDKSIIEPKEDIKEKLGYSPDHMDALLLTFALPVDKQSHEIHKNVLHEFEYNPLDANRIRGQL